MSLSITGTFNSSSEGTTHGRIEANVNTRKRAHSDDYEVNTSSYKKGKRYNFHCEKKKCDYCYRNATRIIQVNNGYPKYSCGYHKGYSKTDIKNAFKNLFKERGYTEDTIYIEEYKIVPIDDDNTAIKEQSYLLNLF